MWKGLYETMQEAKNSPPTEHETKYVFNGEVDWILRWVGVLDVICESLILECFPMKMTNLCKEMVIQRNGN